MRTGLRSIAPGRLGVCLGLRLGASLCLAGCLLEGAARADALKVDLRADVPAPERPTLTVVAEEPLRSVQIALQPQAAAAGEPGSESPETAPQRLSAPSLGAGARRSFSIGTGRIGRTQWVGTVQYQAGGKPGRSELRFETLVTPSTKVRYDREHLSLKDRYVEVQLSRPASRGEVKVIGDDGAELGAGQAELGGAAAGSWLRIPWQERRPGNVLRLELVVRDVSGFPTKVTLWPWSVTVPHDEVRFATASAEIRPEERAKLDESQRRIAAVFDKVKDRLQPPQVAKLYVAGYTDTVGSDGDNLTLSLSRARSIATYLRERGVTAPIFYAGLGERGLKVPTDDNVDEERNRRADYVVALDPPRIAGASWQRLP